MKFCDIVQFYSPLGGGVKRYLGDKVQFFASRPDCEHIVIVPAEEDKVRIVEKSKFYHIKSLPLIGSLSYRMLLNRQKILSIIEQEKPDLMEVGDPYRSAWISLEASRRYTIPIVAFYHSDFPRAMGRTIKRFCGGIIEKQLSRLVNRYINDLYNRMNATIVAGQRMERVLNNCGIKNVVRIPLGTNPDVFKPNPLGALEIRTQLGLKDQDTLLLFVGRLAREKNIQSLLGMMDLLGKSPVNQYHLLFVGDGELRHIVQPVANTRNNITWFRYSESTEHLNACYTAANLFVHAGQYETFGITSLESQSCGTRVLAIRGGGLDDTLEGEEPCIMVNSPSPEDLAAGVLAVQNLEHSQSAQKRRERIITHFSTQQLFHRLLSLYHTILEGNSIEQFNQTGKQNLQSPMDRETLYTR